VKVLRLYLLLRAIQKQRSNSNSWQQINFFLTKQNRHDRCWHLFFSGNKRAIYETISGEHGGYFMDGKFKRFGFDAATRHDLSIVLTKFIRIGLYV